MKKNPLVSICIPTYNSEKLVVKALNSIEKQSYKNIEIIISDDCSQDKTIAVIKSLKINNLRIHRNKKNVGYGDNLKNFKPLVRGDIIFLMAQDDLIINDGLRLTVEAFTANPSVGVVTRPYYWFASDPNVPIRHIPPANRKKTEVIDIRRHPQSIIPIIESVGQLSGLAYRTDLFSQFHSEVFPAHIYPFMEILKNHHCAFLNTYTIAVGTFASQTRSKSSIYDISPTASWLKMFNTVFPEKQFANVKTIAVNHMAQNYLGLIQLKNFAKSPKILYREIYLMLQARVTNLFSPKFWIFAIGTVIIPSKTLTWLVDHYKQEIMVRRLKNINATP